MEASFVANWPSFAVQLYPEVFLKALVQKNHTVPVVSTKQGLLRNTQKHHCYRSYLLRNLFHIIIFFFWIISDFCYKFLIIELLEACIFHITVQPICDFSISTIFITFHCACFENLVTLSFTMSVAFSSASVEKFGKSFHQLCLSVNCGLDFHASLII